MATRKEKFDTGEYYHVYNRGVEKRDIVLDKFDILRFLKGLQVFNTTERIGSIFEHDLKNKQKDSFGTPTSKSVKLVPVQKLVEIAAFNLLNNHYHLVVKQLTEGGISKYMQCMSGGYTKYFNEKYERVGPLFQGAFKSSHLDTDVKLKKLIAYVNLNHVVHKFGTPTSKEYLIRSSLGQYQYMESSKSKSKTVKMVECSIPPGMHERVGQKYVPHAMDIINEIIATREMDDVLDIDLEVGVPNRVSKRREV